MTPLLPESRFVIWASIVAAAFTTLFWSPVLDAPPLETFQASLVLWASLLSLMASRSP